MKHIPGAQVAGNEWKERPGEQATMDFNLPVVPLCSIPYLFLNAL